MKRFLNLFWIAAMCHLWAKPPVPLVFFDAPKGYPVDGGPTSAIAVADFNGDGKPDVAAYMPVCDYCPAKIDVLLNNGHGELLPAKTYYGGSSCFPVNAPQAIAAGDFNNDGKPDLVFVNAGSSTVSILLNKGDGNFYPRKSFAVGPYPGSVAVGDFNNDGNLDLVVAGSASAAVFEYSILLGNGDGTFQPALNYAGYASSIAVGDFNGDGKLDLALLGGTLLVLLGNGDGTFQSPVSYAAGPSPVFVLIGDFDRDGKPDLAVANGNAVSVLLGHGDGTFGPPMTHAVTGAVSLAVGDFDGDGHLDIAATGSNAVSILLGKGDGGFLESRSYNAASSPVSVQAADFNGDGYLDVALGNTAFYVSIMPGGGHGALQQSPVVYPAGVNAASVVKTDFNRDGNPDIAFTTLDGVQVMLGNGDGTFQPAYTVYSAFSNSVAAGDFNRDGNPDLVLLFDTDYGSPGKISVLLGNGDGTFGPPSSFPAGLEPAFPVVADFNGDGILDLALINATEGAESGTMSVLLGTGDGSFQPPLISPAGITPGFLTAGDFDGDGTLDLAVVADSLAAVPVVSILLGNGDGTFRLASTSTLQADQPAGMAAADFNGDGALDLVVSALGPGSSSGGIYILLGNGDGTFRNPVSDVFHNVGTVAVGDFNGDGKPDLVVGSSTTSVLLGKGDGTFEAAINYMAGGGSLVGEFNKSTLPDIVGPYLNSIVVLANTTRQYTAGKQ